MNMDLWIRQTIATPNKKAMPLLSYPAVQQLFISVDRLLKSSNEMALGVRLIADRYDMPFATTYMDLSVEAEAFGATVRFGEDEVPAVTGQLVDDEDAVAELAVPPPDAGRCSMTVSAVAKVKAMDVGKPVFGGMIGPFSLAGRLTDVNEMMFLLVDEPETVHALLEKTTAFLISYAKAFKAAGADGVFMAEPLAGVISPAALEEFSAPYVRRIVEAVQDESFPLYYHNCGNSVVKAADAIFAQGAAGCHFGNAIDLSEMLAKAPAQTIVMGNVDPVSVLAQGTPDSIRAAVGALVAKCGSYPNFVLSSGCDIPATTPWENLEAFFEAAQ